MRNKENSYNFDLWGSFIFTGGPLISNFIGQTLGWSLFTVGIIGISYNIIKWLKGGRFPFFQKNITLKEAATRAYEQLRNGPDTIIIDGMFPSSQNRLEYYVSLIFRSRINIYGERPPSRILEQVPLMEGDINMYSLNQDLDALLHRGDIDKGPQWKNLQVKEVDFNQLIENLKNKHHSN